MRIKTLCSWNMALQLVVAGGLGWESSSYDTGCLYLEGWVGRVVLMTLDACIWRVGLGE